MTLVKIKLDVKDAAYISANPTKVLALNEPIYRNDGLVAYGDGVTPLSGLTFLPLFSGGGGQVDTVTGTPNRISVDASDPASPIVNIDPDYDTAILNAIAAAVAKCPTVLFKQTTRVTHTGTTAATKLYSKLLPAGTFEANDKWRFLMRVIVTLSGTNKVINLKVNTTDSLVGAVTIASYTATNTTIYFIRNFWFNNSLATIGAMAATASVSSDEGTTFVSSTTNSATFDFSQSLYFMIEGTLASAADSILIHEFTAERMRGSEL